MTPSSLPVTVTVLGVLQSSGVNVIELVLTDASAGFEIESGKVTSAVGRVARRNESETESPF